MEPSCEPRQLFITFTKECGDCSQTMLLIFPPSIARWWKERSSIFLYVQYGSVLSTLSNSFFSTMLDPTNPARPTANEIIKIVLLSFINGGFVFSFYKLFIAGIE